MASRTIDLRRPASPAASALPASPFVRIETYADSAPILDAWRELESEAPCSIYQTRAFVLPWVDTLGRKARMEPRFILARDRDRRPAALLCLGLVRRGPIRVATWLGGKDANFNMPLLRRPAAWTEADLKRLLHEAARACGASAPDVFDLPNQPARWTGGGNTVSLNPMSHLANDASPSFAHGTTLPASAETLFAEKLSKDARKKLRKKEAKLASFGPLAYRVATGLDERTRVLDTFLAQKVARFRARGIASDFDAPEMRAFIEAASAPNGSGIELHALYAGERIVAVYGGAAHGDRWSGMFNSFDSDDEIAKTSPADLLLMRIIAACCAAGLGQFDLGIGEARYKAALCDEAIPLFDSFVPVTLRGRAYALAARMWVSAKRRIKRNPRLLGTLNRLRTFTI